MILIDNRIFDDSFLIDKEPFDQAMSPGIKRSRKGRTRLHTDEKILLHLSEFTSRREIWDAPREVTQKGIADRLDMLENNVSRAVKRLIREKVVEKDLRHIKGAKRRKNAYFLTPDGDRIVQEIKENSRSMSVTINTEDGIEKAKAEVALREALKKMKSLTLLDIYLAKENGEEPIPIFEGDRQPMEPGIVGRFQTPGKFFGREDELVVIDKFLNSPAGVLLIRGIAGVGKTTLVLHALGRKNYRGIYIGCEPWTDPVELLDALRQGASELGIENPFMEIPSTNPSPGMLARAARETSGRGLVIIIDDIQKTGGSIDMYLDALCKSSMGSSPLKTIILTRERPDFIDPRYELHGDVISIELEGLGRDAIAEMMGSKGKAGDPNTLWKVTRGHPLFLELALSSSGVDPRARFNEFLDMEAISPLTPNQLKALRLASVSGVIVHRSLFYDVPSEDLERLKSKGLLRESESGLYATHDLIADHILHEMPASKSEEIRRDVIAYLISSVMRIWGEGPDILIRLSSDDSEDTVKLLETTGETFSSVEYENRPEMSDLVKDYIDSGVRMMLGMGMLQEVRLFLTILIDTSRRGRGRMLFPSVYSVDKVLTKGGEGLDFKLRRAGLEISEGEWERAEMTLESIGGGFPDGLLKGRRLAQFQHLRSMISRYKGEYRKMVESQRSAVETYEKMGDRGSAAREKLHLSRTMMRMGDADGALREAIKSASDYSSIPDRTGEIHSCIQCFRSAKSLGKKKTAKKFIERARKLSSKTGDSKLSALVQMELIMSGGSIDSTELNTFRNLASRIEEDDPVWLTAAYLRISRSMEGVTRRKDISTRIDCLKRTHELIEKGGGEDILMEEGHNSSDPFQYRTARMELLEQALSIIDSVTKKGEIGKKGLKMPFVRSRDGDTRLAILRELSDLYEMELNKLGGGETGSLDSNLLDSLMEGYLHALLRQGKHLQRSGNKKGARKVYNRCKSSIKEFEERMSTIPEYSPSWDIRKVKEVLEHNRSKL